MQSYSRFANTLETLVKLMNVIAQQSNFGCNILIWSFLQCDSLDLTMMNVSSYLIVFIYRYFNVGEYCIRLDWRSFIFKAWTKMFRPSVHVHAEYLQWVLYHQINIVPYYLTICDLLITNDMWNPNISHHFN